MTKMTLCMNICRNLPFEKYFLRTPFQVNTLNLRDYYQNCLRMQPAARRLHLRARLKFQMLNLTACIMWLTRVLIIARPMKRRLKSSGKLKKRRSAKGLSRRHLLQNSFHMQKKIGNFLMLSAYLFLIVLIL